MYMVANMSNDKIMKNQEVFEQLNEICTELNAIKNIINKAPLSSAVPYLVNYSVIRSSGSLEQCYKQLIYDFLKVEEKDKLNTYLKSNVLNSSSNPNTGNISKMLQVMDGQWARKFNEHVTLISSTEQHKSNLNSLVQSRNDFAHGVNLSTLKIDNVIKNYNSGVKILTCLDCILNEIELS